MNVVIVTDKNTQRRDYWLVLVKAVFPGQESKVHRMTIQCKSRHTGKRVHEYRAATTIVLRAVQWLATETDIEGNGERCKTNSEKE